MKCIFCEEDFDEKTTPPEHIIPEAMGNRRLICNFVCKSCNHRLGTQVDSKLTDVLYIKMFRFLNGLLNEFHFDESPVDDDPGAKALYVVKKDGTTDLSIFGKTEDDGSILLRFDGEDFTEEEVKKILMRYQRKGIAFKKVAVEITTYLDPAKEERVRLKVHQVLRSLITKGIFNGDSIQKSEIRPTLRYVFDFKRHLPGISRALAKIAFEYYVLHFPDYAETPEARTFRKYILEENPERSEPFSPSIHPFLPLDEFKDVFVFRQNEHIIEIQRGVVWISLFGAQLASVDMDPSMDDTPPKSYSDLDGIITIVNVQTGQQETLRLSEYYMREFHDWIDSSM